MADALKLSDVEVEALRQMRTRLNRPAVSDAAAAALGRAFFQILERVGALPAAAPAKPSAGADQLLRAIRTAGPDELAAALGVLKVRLANPLGWRALQAAGVPQAVISRRLQLAGREPALKDA